MQDTTTFNVGTSHRTIAVGTKGAGLPVVVIDGNAACAARSGAGAKQRALRDRTTTPTRIANGEDDAIISFDEGDGVRRANLWRGPSRRIPHATQSPSREVAHIVDYLLSEFLRELTGRLSRWSRLRAGAEMTSPGRTHAAGGRIASRAAMRAASARLARPSKRDEGFADINPDRTTTCES